MMMNSNNNDNQCQLRSEKHQRTVRINVNTCEFVQTETIYITS